MTGKYFTCRVQGERHQLAKMTRKHHQQQGKVTLCSLISARYVSSKYPQTLPSFEAAEQSSRAGVKVSPRELWQTGQAGQCQWAQLGVQEVFSSLLPLAHKPGYLECIFSLNQLSYIFPFFLFMMETQTSRGHPTELLQPGLAPAALSNGNEYRVACEYRLLEKVPGLH